MNIKKVWMVDKKQEPLLIFFDQLFGFEIFLFHLAVFGSELFFQVHHATLRLFQKILPTETFQTGSWKICLNENFEYKN